MFIDAADIGRIREFTIRARVNSDTWCTFNSASLWLSPTDLLAHRDREIALAHCSDNACSGDSLRALPIGQMERFAVILSELTLDRKEEKLPPRSVFIEISITEHKSDNQSKVKDMEEKQINRLEKQVFFTGFGDIPQGKLRGKIESGDPSFNIQHHQQFGKDQTMAVLHFKRSNEGNYFFNSYDLEVRKQGEETAMNKSFKVSYGNTFTLKEAYNLMMGRSVNKDFIKVDENDPKNNKVYNAWAYEEKSKDKTSTGKNGQEKDESDKIPLIKTKKIFGFVAEKIVSKFPIKNLDYNMDDIMSSIKRGNRQAVVFVKDGKEETMHIEADARSRDIKVFDKDMQPQFLSLKKDQGVSQDQGNSKASGNQNPGDKQQEDNSPSNKSDSEQGNKTASQKTAETGMSMS